MANYTKLTSHELNILLDQYELGEIRQVSPLEGGQANSSLKISTDQGYFTLSICDEKNAEDIANLSNILTYLEEHHFPTTRLNKTRDGNNSIFHDQTPVYLKKYLQGDVVRDLSPKMVRQVGRAIAQLHTLRPLESMQCSFPYGIQAFAKLLNEKQNHHYLDWLSEKKTYLEQAIDPNMPKGFVHGDIFWDNLLFEDELLVAILDFEEACHFYKLFDIGMAAVGCCSNNGKFHFSQITELLTGYAEISPFTPQEQSQLNVFIEYAAVAASFWRFRQYNVRRPDPNLADSYKELSSLADQIHALNGKPFPV